MFKMWGDIIFILYIWSSTINYSLKQKKNVFFNKSWLRWSLFLYSANIGCISLTMYLGISMFYSQFMLFEIYIYISKHIVEMA
jgi:hypothetical protein